MCLLIYTHNPKTIPESHYRNAFQRNGDGAGFCYSKDGEIHVRKGFFTIKSFLEAIPEADGCPSIVHFRWATTGPKITENCHPFDAGNGWYMGHNGVIDGFDELPNESDTGAFVRVAVKPYVDKWKNTPNMPEFQKFWQATIGGSKLVFLHADGSRVIINEEMAGCHWSGDKQTWYSNHSYESYTATFQGKYLSWREEQEEFFTEAGTGGSTKSLKSSTSHGARKQFESVLRTLGLKQQEVCSWCNCDPIRNEFTKVFTSEDGDVVCEQCVLETYEAMEGEAIDLDKDLLEDSVDDELEAHFGTK